jgi:hypothetical protein
MRKPARFLPNRLLLPCAALSLASIDLGGTPRTAQTVSTNGWSLQHNLSCTTPPLVECWMPGYLPGLRRARGQGLFFV